MKSLVWKYEIRKAKVKTALRKLKYAYSIGKLIWDMRNESGNAKFLAMVQTFKSVSPLAHHADFYLSQLLRDNVVEHSTDGKSITIKFHGG